MQILLRRATERDDKVRLKESAWCATADYRGLKFDLTKHLKERFDAEEISIPYPPCNVHIAAPGGQGFIVAAE